MSVGSTVRRLGAILALALALVMPASAAAAPIPWRLFDAPLTAGAADGFAVAANADGAAAVLFR
ncbi:MAG TPA: hypothetical protein VN238_20665, partial [Solirubrobacteraceae bacterium]|nr:hypothetical protein [Solirubrobacteraceae bacterium]